MNPWMHTAGLIVVRIVFPGALALIGGLLLWFGWLGRDDDPGVAWVLIVIGGAGVVVALALLWRLNSARGREDFRWYVVPADEGNDAPPPEPLSVEERVRLTRELDEVNGRWREALGGDGLRSSSCGDERTPGDR